MTSYRCREHPDEPVRPSGSGCRKCAPPSPAPHRCGHCGDPIGRRRGRYCSDRCRKGAYHRRIAADRTATLEAAG